MGRLLLAVASTLGMVCKLYADLLVRRNMATSLSTYIYFYRLIYEKHEAMPLRHATFRSRGKSQVCKSLDRHKYC